MLDIAKIQANIRKRHEEHDRIWNAAIEAAARHCDDMGEEARISEDIRNLKKCGHND